MTGAAWRIPFVCYFLIWRMPRAFGSRVDDPGGPGKADIGDPVFGLQSRGVVVLDLDAAGAEFGHLGADVADLPRCLGLLVSGPNGADAATGDLWVLGSEMPQVSTDLFRVRAERVGPRVTPTGSGYVPRMSARGVQLDMN